MDSAKFKSDPYNSSNCYIQASDVLNVMKSLGLSCKINDLSVYQKAFVHKSYTELKDYEDYENTAKCIDLFKESYETMEFLGDSLLGSVVSTYLYQRYVRNFKVDEGFLTKLKIRLVCGEQLGYLSQELGFSKFMIISKHVDENCSGRQNIHILEDIYEAFLGAIFLDTGNADLVEQFILRSIEAHVDMVDLISKDNNYKDQILRYFQHNFKVHPTYTCEKDEVTNRFICRILKDDDLIEHGEGVTKKKAEQDASRKALLHYHVISP
jgi:ribonuclease-3